MQELRTVSFAIEPLTENEPIPSIVPIVDGVRLTALIEAFERERRYEPVGGYAGITPTRFNVGPLDQYFMASTSNSTFSDHRRYLLGCECGEVGCWPLEARILTVKQEITWEDFRQPFRRERDYSSFGPFRFDCEQYRLSVADLIAEFASNPYQRQDGASVLEV